MITRVLKQNIESKLFKGKAIILLGPRQTGKTTLLHLILKNQKEAALILNGDDPITMQLLNRPNTKQIEQIIGKNRIIFIDEAQRINEIGLTAKIIVDQFPSVQLIMSGSSSFELTQQMHEPLTGRKWTFYLWPISWQEWVNHIGYVDSEQDIENRLVFGFYPDVVKNLGESGDILRELTDSYLYKDVLIYGNLKKPDEIQKLLQALAFQVGNEVSYRELGEMVGVDPKTIERYIGVLEKAFVIFRLNAFSRNLRNEIKTNRKIYFYDNGIRNALIGMLQPIAVRQDIGPLWENFLISERLKLLSYSNSMANTYFWRTTQQQEVDYIEEVEGKIYGYEFKWNDKRKFKFPKTFVNAYNAENRIISRKNFREFIGNT